MDHTQTIEDKIKDIVKSNADSLMASMADEYMIRKTHLENEIRRINRNIESIRGNYAIALTNPSVNIHAQKTFDAVLTEFKALKEYQDLLISLEKAYEAFSK